MSTDVPQASENGGSDEETPNECESDDQTSECSYSDGESMPAYDEADALAEALLETERDDTYERVARQLADAEAEAGEMARMAAHDFRVTLRGVVRRGAGPESLFRRYFALVRQPAASASYSRATQFRMSALRRATNEW